MHPRGRRRGGPILLESLLHDRLAARVAGRPQRFKRPRRPVERILHFPRPQLFAKSRRDRSPLGGGSSKDDGRAPKRESRFLPRRPQENARSHHASPRRSLLSFPKNRRHDRFLRILQTIANG